MNTYEKQGGGVAVMVNQNPQRGVGWASHATCNRPNPGIHPPLVAEHGSPTCPDLVGVTNRQSQSPVTLLSISQSASFARTAIRGRSTDHRSGTSCAPPSPEFLRLGTCASFPSRWFRLPPA